MGLFLILGYFLLMIGVVFFLRKKKEDKTEFLVAGRNASWIATAFSIAATWVWAPSMFTASQKAYTQGFDGVFWFVVPNVLTLVLFAFYANKLRQRCPNGWTFSGFIKDNYSKRTQSLFVTETLVLQICAIAIQLLAAADIFHKVTGIPFFWTTIIIGAIPLFYTFKAGLRSSIITDLIKMSIIVGILLIGLPILLSNAPAHALFKGLGGISGEFGNIFDKTGISVFLNFGLSSTLVLLSGTFGDQMFWQRAFAVREQDVKKTMLLAAGVFALVPICLSMFGFIAAGSGLIVTDTQLTNVAAITAYAPKWFLYLFFVLILSGLISTVDSVLCAISSVAGHDFYERIKDNSQLTAAIKSSRLLNALLGDEVRLARTSMVAVSILGIALANVNGLTITGMWLVYGTMRSGVLLPTMYAIRGKHMSERGLFIGLLVSWIVGLPLFAYANNVGNTALIVTGSLVTMLASGILSRVIKDKA